MEQKPIPGQDVFAPPDAGLAQQYLDTAEQVRRVRGTRLDRRSLGRVQCVGAVALGLYVTLFLLSANTTVTRAPVMSILLIPFLVWVQVSGGLMERLGFRWRTTRERWLVPLILVVGIGGVALLVGYILRTRDAVPPWIAFTVGSVVFAAAAVAGAVQLWKGRGTAAGAEPAAVAVAGAVQLWKGRGPRPARNPLRSRSRCHRTWQPSGLECSSASPPRFSAPSTVWHLRSSWH